MRKDIEEGEPVFEVGEGEIKVGPIRNKKKEKK